MLHKNHLFVSLEQPSTEEISTSDTETPINPTVTKRSLSPPPPPPSDDTDEPDASLTLETPLSSLVTEDNEA